ncbi:hypothetical protein TMEN_7143 [Trichophyton mentagrophytes]|nr:hypothetical protein TMEN_7143 [Trichophyton mentagrophytes]
MSYSIHDQQRVFLTYRAHFGSQNFSVKKRRKIKKLVHSHERSTQPLIKSLGNKKIVAILQSLLKRGIFSSESQAKLAFPSLFLTFATQTAQHSASGVGGAEPQDRPFQQVQTLDEDYLPGDIDFDNGHIPSHDAHCPAITINGIQVPSLGPSYIPYAVQHVLLTKIQCLLEECCYEFTSKWAPALLLKKKWDCPEAIELNQWVRVMIQYTSSLPADALEDKHKANISEIFEPAVQVRHSAVHRLPVSTKRLEQFVDGATVFVSMLRDPLRESQLRELGVNLKRIIKQLELSKNVQETQLQEKLDDICKQREDLDKREKDAVATMVEEYEENRCLAGSLLEESIRSVFRMGKESDNGYERPCVTEHEAMDNPPLTKVDSLHPALCLSHQLPAGPPTPCLDCCQAENSSSYSPGSVKQARTTTTHGRALAPRENTPSCSIPYRRVP